jgi:RNA polymerase primary sigma factor
MMETTPATSASGLNRHFSGCGNRPPLSREQEASLSREIRNGGRKALHALVEANQGFVVKVAGEYRNLGLPFEDLMNEGNLGLIEAAKRFDGQRGTRFVTCAVWWIRKAILRALSENRGPVRVPAAQQRHVARLREAERTLSREFRRSPHREELSRRLEMSPAKLDRLLQSRTRELRLDAPVAADSEDRLVDSLTFAGDTDPEQDLLREETRRVVEHAVELLTDQERTVIRYRFGLSGEPPLVLKDVGAILGVSRERVRQIESRAIERLRRILSRTRFPASSAARRFVPSRSGLKPAGIPN